MNLPSAETAAEISTQTSDQTPAKTVDGHALAEALQNCAREPIRQIGSIQAAGVLIAVVEDGLTVCSVSANLPRLVPCSPAAAIGQPLASLLGDAATAHLRALIGKRTQGGEWPG
ncbi:hypothetical protein JZU56_00165, partial [bacterium]|nr:hypothetical protein [bacterium]